MTDEGAKGSLPQRPALKWLKCSQMKRITLQTKKETGLKKTNEQTTTTITFGLVD